MPIELVYFNVECESNQLHFSWQTASELNNDYFEIEQSNDAIHFIPLEKIESKNGNTNTQQNYSISVSTHPDSKYFRLKQVDKDNKFSYSPK